MHAVWRAALRYFVVVFGFGFVFGVIRTLWAVPRFGERTAELLEIPLMILVIAWFGPRTGRELQTVAQRLAAGAIALALMVAAELWFVLRLRHLALEDYIAQRDPLAGSLYLIALLCFAIAPVLAGLGPRSGPGEL